MYHTFIKEPIAFSIFRYSLKITIAIALNDVIAKILFTIHYCLTYYITIDQDHVEAYMKFILASGSPRRKALLTTIGVPIHLVSPANIVEQRQLNELPLRYCQRLANEKSIAQSFENALVLAADTIVAKEDMVFEKPIDDEDAFRILKTLQGTWHEVITAWSLYDTKNQKIHKNHAISKVLFRPLTHNECVSYIQTGEGVDKAGGYGIQGVGAALISTIQGSYSNIVGLPIEQIAPVLKQYNLLG